MTFLIVLLVLPLIVIGLALVTGVAALRLVGEVLRLILLIFALPFTLLRFGRPPDGLFHRRWRRWP